MVQLTVNGETRTLSEETSLSDFLSAFGLDARRIAIAHNGTVLYRQDWPSITLRDGDRLEIVRMIGGGSDPTLEHGGPALGT
jgi:sulfur carrier protein